MEFTILYAGTLQKLNDEIARKKKDGWHTKGETIMIDPQMTSDVRVPSFIYYSQSIIRGEEG